MTSEPPHRRLMLSGALAGILSGAAALGLGSCARVDPGRKPLRTLVLRMSAASRPVFWEKAQAYAHENGLASSLVPQRPDRVRNFAFVLRGNGIDIVCRNNAYDPLEPDDYAVAFYGSALFGANAVTLNRFADSFLIKTASDSSVRLITDSGPAR